MFPFWPFARAEVWMDLWFFPALPYLTKVICTVSHVFDIENLRVSMLFLLLCEWL